MKNKIQWIKLILAVFAVLWFSLSFSTAINFHLNFENLEGWLKALSREALAENIVKVHFADNDNNFGGFIYFSNGLWESEEGESYEVWTSNTSYYECSTKVKWFYYNAERGERLWPLDDETWKNSFEGLQTTWWIYTVCSNPWYKGALEKCEQGNDNVEYDQCVKNARQTYNADGFGYYGSLTHTYSWQTYNLTVWVKYKKNSNGFVTIDNSSSLAPTFVRLENKYPIGFIYDYNGWLGLAWCELDENQIWQGNFKFIVEHGGSDISKVFQYSGWLQDKFGLGISCSGSTESSMEDALRIIIEWIVWMDDSGDSSKFWGIANSSDKKMQYFGTKTASNVALMNSVVKRAESLCRWKWSIFRGIQNFQVSNKKNIVCLDGANWWLVDLSAISISYLKGRTVIVKNADVMIKPRNDVKYDIFIDGGNLYIDEDGAEKYLIGDKGFVGDQQTKQYFNAYVLKRNGISEEDIEMCYCIDGHLPNPWWENGENPWDGGEDPWDGGENLCNDDPMCVMYDFDWDEDIDEDDWDFLNAAPSPTVYWKNIAVASVIKWNFIVNWHVKGYNQPENEEDPIPIILENKYFIYGKLMTKDSISDLERVFVRRCDNGVGSDGYFCPKFSGNHYWNAALVVIDQNYESPLFGL